MAAFEHAVALGYRYVETDVRASADGEVFVFHDATLDRCTDRHGTVERLTARQVRQARTADGAPVPTLVELLTAWPELRVNIDVKHDHAVTPVLDVLRRTGTHHRVCLGAFSDARIRRLRAGLPPGTATALAPAEVVALAAAARTPALDRLVPRDVPCVQVPHRRGPVVLVDERFVDAAHRQRRQVHVWTVNDEMQMRTLLALGVDGLVSDETATLAAVADEHRSRR